ncbi:NAD-dependent epimerase/dehydratase family protein [bacterium endosymbiont of Bathymodiolus sp. 5 South]|jgi:nucleoside-diphosphate-sugar epimerase|uniref:NAD-dependent epimerase/dehydratase family protein n=1 Tax=bacterium endosymbiont of Bathymodiolus sp. 5 South TaxID=1181670 RepID=UPI0010AF2C4E|nr:NAD(P)-dependent oxidoreductase [bacterium endosymbiont of Bathymodiolus sp. 5 South]SHN91930.1 putative dTDP-glucose 4,6-dehydratase [bacterium endosymbiont of Bathymodiolus sp. 5 South]VVH58366.1 putative dTDP-glucose 4,6-dehydratase [uncultured Gammaproteobacteria bacterium]
MKIAILGATSRIAQDLILSFSKNKEYNFSLFSRNIKLLKEWASSANLNGEYQVQAYDDFSDNQKYDIIINFVGIGDPEKAQKMGSDIFKITEKYDDMVLEYLKLHKETKYFFLSSGAVYGGNYQKPVDENTVATIDINNLKSTDWYTLAKLHAEAKHRALFNFSIVDVRVFNYFSHTQDMNARFLITDIVRAIKNKKVFKTSADNIVRDFITPPDFYHLVQSIIEYKPINTALDCYTQAPISKFDLLTELQQQFGLDYSIDKVVNIVNATGSKMHYYSTYKKAEKMGYKPENTALEGVTMEMKAILIA